MCGVLKLALLKVEKSPKDSVLSILLIQAHLLHNLFVLTWSHHLLLGHSVSLLPSGVFLKLFLTIEISYFLSALSNVAYDF